MMRIDIEEGEMFPDCPVSFGRIKSLPEFREKYVSALLFGWRFFVAFGLYDRKKYSARWRFFNAEKARQEHEDWRRGAYKQIDSVTIARPWVMWLVRRGVKARWFRFLPESWVIW